MFYFFLIWMSFTYFFPLIAVARTSNIRLNKSGKSGILALFLILKEKLLTFFLSLRMMLAVSLSYMVFIMLRCTLSLLTLLRVFVINGCSVLSNAFFCIYWVIRWFLSFVLLVLCIMLIDLLMLNHPCILGSIWSWCVILLICFWIQFDNVLLRISASMFIKDIGL